MGALLCTMASHIERQETYTHYWFVSEWRYDLQRDEEYYIVVSNYLSKRYLLLTRRLGWESFGYYYLVDDLVGYSDWVNNLLVPIVKDSLLLSYGSVFLYPPFTPNKKPFDGWFLKGCVTMAKKLWKNLMPPHMLTYPCNCLMLFYHSHHHQLSPLFNARHEIKSHKILDIRSCLL